MVDKQEKRNYGILKTDKYYLIFTGSILLTIL